MECYDIIKEILKLNKDKVMYLFDNGNIEIKDNNKYLIIERKINNDFIVIKESINSKAILVFKRKKLGNKNHYSLYTLNTYVDVNLWIKNKIVKKLEKLVENGNTEYSLIIVDDYYMLEVLGESNKNEVINKINEIKIIEINLV
jgi:hypothetical protein